jgi:hypothetical protein
MLQAFCCRQHIPPLDFSPLESLERVKQSPQEIQQGGEGAEAGSGREAVGRKFGSTLMKLVLNSQMEEVETGCEGAIEPEELAPLRYLGDVLTDLRFGGEYPITEYVPDQSHSLPPLGCALTGFRLIHFKIQNIQL